MGKILLILLFITLSLGAHQNKIVLAFPWKHQFQFAGYYMAQEKGFYKEASLDVTFKEYVNGTDYIGDVSFGKYQFGVGHSSLIIDKYNKYKNLILLNAINQSSPLALVSLKYKNLKDLVGKKVMMTDDQTAIASINAMLHSQNLTKDSYTVVGASYDVTSLLRDADFMSVYTSNEIYTLKQKDLQYFLFHPKEYGYDFYSDILFTSKEMLKHHQKEVDDFRRASLKGWKYAYEHIDETVDVILKNYNTQNKTRGALLYEAQTLKKLALVDGVNFGDINSAKLQEITTAYRLLGLIKNKKNIPFKNFVYTSKENFEFIFTKKPSTEYFKFYHNSYFKFMLILVIVILIMSIVFKLRTEKILAEQQKQLKENNEIFNKHICSSTTDTDGVIISVSDALCKCTGYKREELISKRHNILKSESTSNELYKDLWMTISSGHTWQGKLKNNKKDGSEYWIYIIISPVFDNKQSILCYESIVTDISLEVVLENFNDTLAEQVKEKTKELEELAMTDKLTGLYNRVKLDSDLEVNFNYFQSFDENFSVIIFDIDKFKDVNDNFGHQVGDVILQEVTAQITSNVRSTDVVGRWGGEEFLVICPKSDKNATYLVAQKIRESIESYNFSRVGTITVSAGVCDIKSAKDVDEMVSFADVALYQVKKSGRNNVLKHESSL